MNDAENRRGDEDGISGDAEGGYERGDTGRTGGVDDTRGCPESQADDRTHCGGQEEGPLEQCCCRSDDK